MTHNRAALIGRGICYPREWTTPEIGWCHAELINLMTCAHSTNCDLSRFAAPQR
jgi:hypothetical protein